MAYRDLFFRRLRHLGHPVRAWVLLAGLGLVSSLSCSVIARREVLDSDRAPAAVTAASLRSLLATIFGDSRGMSERALSDWLVQAKAAPGYTEAHLMARRIRLGVASISRSEIEGSPEIRELLLKDVAELRPEDLLRLHSWAQLRLARVLGTGVSDPQAQLARDVVQVLQKQLIPVSEGRQVLRRTAIDFIDYLQPKIVEQVIDSRTVLDAMRAARLDELPEENAVELLKTLDVMIAYHGSDWDGVRSVIRLRGMGPEALRDIRAAYREAVLGAGPQPDLMALAGKTTAHPRMSRELDFVTRRDVLLRRIDRLRWFTSNPVRATEHGLQRSISRLDYLIRIGDKKAARAMVQRQFTVVETSALYIQRFRLELAEAVGSKASPSRIRQLESLIEQQERILGAGFEEYRALRGHLGDLVASKAGSCDAACRRMAQEIEDGVGMNPSAMKTFVTSFGGMSRPSLEAISDIFQSSILAQEKSLERVLFEEARSTLMTMASSVMMISEFQRLAARIPALHKNLKWTRAVLFFLYDARARHLHFPQLSRILRAQGGAGEQLQMLEQLALPPNEDLLVTFARRMDQDYRDLWKAMKQGASTRFEAGSDGAERGASLIGRMEAAESSAALLGGISTHLDHSPAVKLGAIVVAGYGGYSWYQSSREEQKQIEELTHEMQGLAEKIECSTGDCKEKAEIQEFVEKVRKVTQAP